MIMWQEGLFVLDGRVLHVLRPCYLCRSVGAPSEPMIGTTRCARACAQHGIDRSPLLVYISTIHICEDTRI